MTDAVVAALRDRHVSHPYSVMMLQDLAAARVVVGPLWAGL